MFHSTFYFFPPIFKRSALVLRSQWWKNKPKTTIKLLLIRLIMFPCINLPRTSGMKSSGGPHSCNNVSTGYRKKKCTNLSLYLFEVITSQGQGGNKNCLAIIHSCWPKSIRRCLTLRIQLKAEVKRVFYFLGTLCCDAQSLLVSKERISLNQCKSFFLVITRILSLNISVCCLSGCQSLHPQHLRGFQATDLKVSWPNI